MFGGTAHVVLGSGLTIAGATFCLSFTRLPYFQSLGVPLAIGMTVGVAGRADARRRDHRRGESVRQRARAQARDEGARMAQDRRRGRPVAGPDPGRDDRAVPHRPADPARVPDQLQRPQLPTRGPAGQRGLRGGRPALLAGPDEPRTADDRERPRSAQLRGLPRHRQDREGRVPGAGHLAGPGDHPARR